MSNLIYKLPSNLNAPVQTQKLYVAYLWLVKHSEGGRVYKKDVDKSRGQYWGKKLCRKGWVHDKGDYWGLESYQAIWRLMGCKRVYKYGKSRGIKGYHYTKFVVSPSLDNKDFFIRTLHEIRRFLVQRKINRIKQRLKTSGVSRDNIINQQPLFGVNAVARTLGYSQPCRGNSSSSGHKYRDQYFKMIKPPLQRVLKMRGGEVPVYMFPCYRLDLD